jgi:hypothetical protein
VWRVAQNVTISLVTKCFKNHNEPPKVAKFGKNSQIWSADCGLAEWLFDERSLGLCLPFFFIFSILFIEVEKKNRLIILNQEKWK